MKYFPEFIQKLTKSSTYQCQSIHQVSSSKLAQFKTYAKHQKVCNVKMTFGHNSHKYFLEFIQKLIRSSTYR